MNAPIIGQEKLILRIQTPQTSPKDETIINYIDTPLSIYKVNMVMGEGENALMYSLNFTTQESFRNQVCKISQSYKGQPSEIVEKILRDKNYLDSTRKLFVEETANHVKVVFPNMRPFMHLFTCAKYQIQNSIINHQHIYSMRLQKDFILEVLMVLHLKRRHTTMKRIYQTH